MSRSQEPLNRREFFQEMFARTLGWVGKKVEPFVPSRPAGGKPAPVVAALPNEESSPETLVISFTDSLEEENKRR